MVSFSNGFRRRPWLAECWYFCLAQSDSTTQRRACGAPHCGKGMLSPKPEASLGLDVALNALSRDYASPLVALGTERKIKLSSEALNSILQRVHVNVEAQLCVLTRVPQRLFHPHVFS
jgi:hypothetical protein